MLSPFLAPDGKDRTKDKNIEVDIAFMGLLKAMSILKSSPADIHIDLSVETTQKAVGANSMEDIITEPVSSEMNHELSEEERTVKGEKCKMDIHQQIQQAMASKNVCNVVELFQKSIEFTNGTLNENMLFRVIHFLSYHDLRACFTALKYYVERLSDQGKIVKLDTYRRVILGIQNAKIRGHDLVALADEIYHHIRDSFSEGKTVIYQHILLPALVAQLASHKDHRVNGCAKRIVEYISREDFPLLNPELCEAILNEASLDRVGHFFLPYHSLLTELVSRGKTKCYKPQPATVCNLLQNYYPYSDANATCEILRAIKILATQSPSYRVDIGTLEAISLATQRGQTELNLLVWDLIELFGHQPTESMFEDVILSFGSIRSDAKSFKALIDMENNGYVPSSVLLRQIAFKLSGDFNRLRHARNLFTWNSDHRILSTSTMNCLLLGYGIKKDIDTAFDVFEDFAKYELQTDKNTFTFLMESLYLSVKDKLASSSGSPEDIDDILAIIDTVICSMELARVERSAHFYYEHIRLLCLLTKVDDAKSLLENAIDCKLPIKAGCIVMVATNYVNRGDFCNARYVASLSEIAGCGEAPSYLLRRIRGLEQEH
ncbi:hypothetical protein ACHAWX_004362 [Stephanocyclus meneghinianus]